MGVLIGTYNTTTAADNILIGRSNESTHANVIAFGTDLHPSQNSIFIGSGIQEDRDHSNTNNIVMGHNIEMNDVRSAISNSILIGNNLNDWDILLDGSEGLSANRTIAIGNDINPHNRGTMTFAGHYTINIGNRISTSSHRSINIGQDIRSNFPGVLGADANPTIAIGRNITFPDATPLPPPGGIGFPGRPIEHSGTIIIGTSHPTNYPNPLGQPGFSWFPDAPPIISTHTGPPPHSPNAFFIPAGPRPRFVVGGYATWPRQMSGPTEGRPNLGNDIPVHFIYIDDFANVYFGFTNTGPMTEGGIISSYPFRSGSQMAPLPAGGMPAGSITGGTLFARQLVALEQVAVPSDRSLKTNIVSIRDRVQPTETSSRRRSPSSNIRFSETLFSGALSEINLYSYNYNFAAADPREQWGFMAQDVLPHFPHLVTTFDGETLSMTYAGFIPILWTINQDQQTQIEELQDEVSTLRDELAEIRYLLNQLKNRND